MLISFRGGCVHFTLLLVLKCFFFNSVTKVNGVFFYTRLNDKVQA